MNVDLVVGVYLLFLSAAVGACCIIFLVSIILALSLLSFCCPLAIENVNWTGD
jgi:hypothetical protein